MSSSKTTNSNQTTTSNQVQTPTNPAYVDSALQGLTGQISNLSNVDPESLIAGPSALETQAAGTAGALTPSSDFGTASSGLTGVGNDAVGANSILPNLQSYMSPYTDDVVNSTLANYDNNAGYSQAQNKLNQATDDTFGGSGGSIETALANQQLGMGRAQLEAQLRDQAFTTGSGLAEQDANRAQAGQQESAADAIAAAQGLTNNGVAGDNSQRANIDTQGSLGQILQQIQQAQAGAPISLLGTQAGLLDGLPLGLEHGTTQDGTSNTTGSSTTTSSDPLGTLGSLAMGTAALFGAPFTGGASLGLLGSLGAAGGLGASAASGTLGAIVSDERLKRDVQKVGELANGLGVYLYRYLWSPILFLGVMAQEVLKVKPEAVFTMADGHLAVDYGAL